MKDMPDDKMSENAANLRFLTPERKKFIRLLAERGVSFIIVGGEAMRAAGFDRLTKDLDIVIPRNEEAIEEIKEVALEFGYRIPRVTEMLLSSHKFSAMYLRLAPRDQDTKEVTHHVDILFADVYLPQFESAIADAIEIPANSGVRYASVTCLLEMKKLAAAQPGRSPESRLKDEADIAFLTELWDSLGKAALQENQAPETEGGKQE